eukprot:tig00001366_g8391.t1
MASLIPGDAAPAFATVDQAGAARTLDSLLEESGKLLCLYFYPKDDTPGCTKEACGFQSLAAKLREAGVLVAGCSPQNEASKAKFSKKYKLNDVILLADEEHAIAEAYGVWQKKKFMGREFMGALRCTFLVDKEKKIAKVYSKVSPAEHAAEILAFACGEGGPAAGGEGQGGGPKARAKPGAKRGTKAAAAERAASDGEAQEEPAASGARRSKRTKKAD